MQSSAALAQMILLRRTVILLSCSFYA